MSDATVREGADGERPLLTGDARPARLAVCIATLGRPKGLRRLLEAIDRQTFAGEPAPELRVVVVENDVPGAAREVCAERAATSRWPLHYVNEPRVGIPYARNRAVASARPWADFIAFIDDDEVPEPWWVDELLRVQRAYGSDVVAGRLVAQFDEPVPDWILRDQFFGHLPRPTGTPLKVAPTCNVLVRTTVFDSVGGFDERFAHSGGSDTHFFLRARRRGHPIVWADHAVVRECVPARQATLRWILRRSYRTGNTWSLCEREFEPGLRTRVRRVRRAVSTIVAGVVRLPPAALSGKAATVRCLRRISDGLGGLTGAFGFRFQEFHPTRWLNERTEHAR